MSERAPRRLRHAARGGRRLDEELREWLPAVLDRGLSRSALRRLVMAGAVRVDGRPCRRMGLPLRGGARLEVAVRLDLLPPTPARLELRPSDVLFADEALIAVNKPPGVPTHAGADPGRPNLVDAVRAFLARQGGGGRLGVHQRLDRDTSGVVLFTKAPEADRGLAEQFAAHAVAKVYHALTRRPARLPRDPWELETRLGVTGSGRRARMASLETGKAARTRFRLLEALPHALLIEARPLSGRKHQVRAHLAECGLPILGDQRYGGSPNEAPRAMLHARRLAFRHPLTGAEITIEGPYPADFHAALERARRGGAAPRG